MKGDKGIVLQGVSGSGKSTYARKLVVDHPATDWKGTVIISADDYFTSDSGDYRFDPSKLSAAHNYCMRTFLAYLDAETTYSLIIIDNTSTTAVEIAPYMAVALAYGYEAEVHRLAYPGVETAFNRNVHNVPKATIISQSIRIANERLPPWWKLVNVEVK